MQLSLKRADVNKEAFVSNLSQRMRHNVAEYLFQDVVFHVDDEFIVFQPLEKRFQLIDLEDKDTKLPIVHGTSWSLIFNVITGRIELLDAFKSKQIHTNGYLPQLFILMIVFQPERAAHLPE